MAIYRIYTYDHNLSIGRHYFCVMLVCAGSQRETVGKEVKFGTEKPIALPTMKIYGRAEHLLLM